MTDEHTPDIEHTIKEMQTYAAYEHAVAAARDLDKAAALVRSAYTSLHALGAKRADPCLEAARSAVDDAAAFTTALRLQHEAEFVDPTT